MHLMNTVCHHWQLESISKDCFNIIELALSAYLRKLLDETAQAAKTRLTTDRSKYKCSMINDPTMQLSILARSIDKQVEDERNVIIEEEKRQIESNSYGHQFLKQKAHSICLLFCPT